MTPNTASRGDSVTDFDTGGILAAGCPAPVPEPVDDPAVDFLIAISGRFALAFLMARIRAVLISAETPQTIGPFPGRSGNRSLVVP